MALCNEAMMAGKSMWKAHLPPPMHMHHHTSLRCMLGWHALLASHKKCC